MRSLLLLAAACAAAPLIARPDISGDAVQQRMESDAKAGKPLVAHVIVALADNATQGLVPVPKLIGNGQDPEHNLYWGARYGVRTWFTRAAGWRPVPFTGSKPAGVLDRRIFRREITRPSGRPATLYLVADAWDGRDMRGAVVRVLNYSAGAGGETLIVGGGASAVTLPIGGTAHLIAFIGHNGLMDFAAPVTPLPSLNAMPRSIIVLACASRSYFTPLLKQADAHPLLLTNGLMAPEAYTLDAALVTWFTGGTASAVRLASAKAYDQFQHCGIKGAKWLFAEK